MSGHSSLFCSRHVASRICSHYVFQAATACGGLGFQVVDQGARLGLREMGIWRRSGSDMKGRHIFRPGTMQGFEAPKARGETSLSVSSWKLHHRSSREYRDGFRREACGCLRQPELPLRCFAVRHPLTTYIRRAVFWPFAKPGHYGHVT